MPIRWFVRFSLLAVLCLAPALLHAQFPTRVWALTGDAVPTGGPAGEWHAIDGTFIDAAGAVAVHGSAKRSLIYRLTAQETATGTLRALLYEGQPVSGLGAGVKINGFSPTNDEGTRLDGHSNGRLIAPVFLSGPMIEPPNIRALVVADARGARIVARAGQPLSATFNDVLTSIRTGRLDSQGRVSFHAIGSAHDRDYLLQYEEGNLSVLTRATGVAPRPIDAKITSPFGTPLVSEDGSTVVTCALRFPDMTSSRHAIVLINAAGGKVIARSGDAAPGLPDGWVLSTDLAFTLRSRNAAGQVLFRAVATRPGERTPRAGLWLGDGSGPAELIAIEGMTIPETEATMIGSFSTGVVNARGDVAFHNGGLFLKRAGSSLARIAYAGMQHPLRPVGETFPAPIASQLQMDRRGNLVFATPGSIWVYTAVGELRPLLLSGASVGYKGKAWRVSAPRLITSASGGEDGRRRCLSDNGKVAITASLVSGSAFETGALVTTIVRVGGPNIAPIARDDRIDFTTAAAVAVTIPVLANDTDDNHDLLAITSLTQPGAGKAVIKGNAIVYTPAKTFTGEDTFSYTVSDAFGGSSTAQVTARKTGLVYRGTYGSTLSHDGRDYGAITVTATDSRRFTAIARLFNKTYRLAGVLSSDGRFTQHIWEGEDAANSTCIEFAFVPGAGGMRLTGTISRIPANFVPGEGFTVYTIAPVARFVSALPPGISAGRLLARFTPAADATVPAGVAYAAGSLKSRAVAVLSGRLPDGAAFATSARLMEDRRLTLTMQPKRSTLSIMTGILAYSESTEFAGELAWTKIVHPLVPSSAVTTAVDARIFRYVPPARGASIIPAAGSEPRPGNFHFELPTMGTLTRPALLGIDDRLTYPPVNPPTIAARINRSNGLMSGSINFPAGFRTSFHGAFYPPATDFAGVLLHNGVPGAVVFGLTPPAEE